MATSAENVYQNYFELIDSGSKKFKYGLVWYLIYELVDPDSEYGHGLFGSDYHYIDLLKLSEEEIKNKLEPILDKTIVQKIMVNDPRIECCLVYRLIDDLRKLHFIPHFESNNLNSMTDWLSEIMYYILIHPEEFKRRKSLMETVSHAANRVIRNYQGAKLVVTSKEILDHCLEYVNLYYKYRGLKVHVDW